MKPRRPLAWSHLAVLVVLTTALVFILTELILYSRNSFRVHPEWTISKKLLADSVMGSNEAMRTRNLLHRNRLNLDTWHGFHEILLSGPLRPGSVRLDFLAGQDGYLIVIFNKNAASFSGIRLSRASRFPSMFFRASAVGEFTHTQPLSDVELSGDWHTLELGVRPSSLELVLDGRSLPAIAESALPRQVIGFRAGRHEVMIDNVEVRDTKGKLIIKEDFRNDRHYWSLVSVLAMVFAASIGLLLWVARYRGADLHTMALRVFLAELVLIAVALVYFGFDYHFWSRQYPFRGVTPWGAEGAQMQGFETFRSRCFSPFSRFDSSRAHDERWSEAALIEFLNLEPIVDRSHDLRVIRSESGVEEIEIVEDNLEAIRAYREAHQLEAVETILFLGTSQTWGSGALRSTERLVFQAHRALAATSSGRLVTVNAGVRGSRSEVLLRRYREHLIAWEPDVLVVNLSNNDSESGFGENLSALIELGAEHGIRTILVQEPNSMEFPNSNESKHRIMSDVARGHEVPCLGLNGYLADVYDTGLIWWDKVHLSSYGQRLAGEFVARGISDESGRSQ